MNVIHLTSIGERHLGGHEIDGGGGAGNVVLMFHEFLKSDRDFNLHVTYLAPGLFATRARDVGFSGHLIPAKWKRTLGRAVYIVPDQESIAKVITDHNIDLVHAHNFAAAAGYAKQLSGLNIPMICTVHQDVTEYVSSSPNILRRWVSRKRAESAMSYYRKIENRCFRFVAVSTAVKQSMVDNGFGSDKIDIIHNGLSSRELERPTYHDKGAKVRICIANRLVPGKRVDLILDAMHRLVQLHYDIDLTIYGDGPDRCQLEEQVARLGLEDRVCFAGFVDDPQLYFDQHHLYILSTDSEGMPLAILEAMQARLPVIATRVGGVPDIIENNVDGITVLPGDVSALAEAIRELIDDPSLCELLGTNGYAKATREFSLLSSINGYEALYNDAILQAR